MHACRTAARPGQRRPAPLQLRFATAGIALAALLAACSSPAASGDGVVSLASSAPGSSAAPSASAQTPEEAMLSYSQCMRDHGIDMPDPVFNSNGDGGGTVTQQGSNLDPKSQPGFQAAEDACKHFMEDVKRSAGGKPMTAAEQQAFLDFAACMREHGVDMADPTFEGGGVSIQIGGPGPKDGAAGGGGGVKIDPQSPAFAAAQTACQHVLQDAGLGKFGAGPATGPAATPENAAASAAPSQPAN
jgi:hypothetical protein